MRRMIDVSDEHPMSVQVGRLSRWSCQKSLAVIDMRQHAGQRDTAAESRRSILLQG